MSDVLALFSNRENSDILRRSLVIQGLLFSNIVSIAIVIEYQISA